MSIRRAAIVAPLRSPVGTFGGSLKSIPVEALGAAVVTAILEQTRLDPALIEDVIFAQSYANGETPCTGRWVALEAGLPVQRLRVEVRRWQPVLRGVTFLVVSIIGFLVFGLLRKRLRNIPRFEKSSSSRSLRESAFCGSRKTAFRPNAHSL